MGAASKVLSAVAGFSFDHSGPARCTGGLYPLPLPAALPTMQLPGDAPRYLQDRHRRRRLHNQRLRGSIISLNAFNVSTCKRDTPRSSGSSWSPARPQESSAENALISRAHAFALQHILSQHVKNRPPHGVATGHAASSELIECRSPYSLETAITAR